MTWHARIIQSPAEFHPRLQLWSDQGDRVEYLTNDGNLWKVIAKSEAESTYLDDNGILIPAEALQALAEALLPHAPHAVEVKRLEEALRIERERVDSVFGATLDRLR